MGGVSDRIVPAALALREFGPALAEEVLEGASGDMAVVDEEAARAAALEQAREEGRRQALREAEATFAEERERLRRAHEEELRQREAHWRREAGERLALALEDGLAALEEALGERLAMLLVPLMEQAAREKALARLHDVLREMQERDAALRVGLSGPGELLEAFRRRLDDAGGGEMAWLALEEDETATELVARVDGTVVETRLRAWLDEALGAVRAEAAGVANAVEAVAVADDEDAGG